MSINRRDLIKGSMAASALGFLSATNLNAAEVGPITKAVPKTGEQVPVIGIGTNRYSVGTSEEERAPLRDVLKTFNAARCTVIDTAPMYRKSEAVLGELISELDIADQFFMATKCDTSGGDKTRAQMQNSSDLLGYGTFDLMQVHSLKNWQKQLPVIREWQQQGRVRYVGISTSQNNQHEELAEIMRTEPLDFVQLNYSILDRTAEELLLPIAADKGIAIMVNLPFARAKVFSAVKGVELPEWAAEFDCYSWGQFFLKYVVSHPAVTCAIPGTTKLRHAKDNVAAAMGSLPDASQRARQEALIQSL